MKISFPSAPAFLLLALFMTVFMCAVPSGSLHAQQASTAPVNERPAALKLRFSIKDEHIVNWRRNDKGVRVQLSPGATAAFYRFTSAHLNKAFDLYINDLYVISLMNENPVRTGGLFISVRKAAQEKVVGFLPMRKEKIN